MMLIKLNFCSYMFEFRPYFVFHDRELFVRVQITVILVSLSHLLSLYQATPKSVIIEKKKNKSGEKFLRDQISDKNVK